MSFRPRRRTCSIFVKIPLHLGLKTGRNTQFFSTFTVLALKRAMSARRHIPTLSYSSTLGERYNAARKRHNVVHRFELDEANVPEDVESVDQPLNDDESEDDENVFAFMPSTLWCR